MTESPSTSLAVHQPIDDVFRRLEEGLSLPAGAITLVGLELTSPDMSREDWQALGRGLGGLEGWTRWALGDWLNFGEGLYGEEAYDATEGMNVDRYDMANRVTGLAAGTLMNYASVCARIARSRRRAELPFGVHEAVAALDADDQVRWLQAALDHSWGRDELRQAIRDEKNPPADPDPDDSGGEERLSVGERIEKAAVGVVNQAQPTSGGLVEEVPVDAMTQLRIALGRE